MNENFLVSVLIATYNRSDFIENCLDSIFSQTVSDIEVIIVDDCSTDNTESIVFNLREYKFKDKRILYLKNKQNRGVSFNNNLAFSHSKGQFIALIGDDDEWCYPSKLQDQLDVFRNDPSVGLVATHWKDVVDSQEVKLHTPIVPIDLKEHILKRNGLYCGSSVLISRKAWEDVQGLDINIPKGTDSDLFRRIVLKNYKTFIIPKVAVSVNVGQHERMTPTNTSEGIKRDILSNEICLIKFRKEFLTHKKSRRWRKWNGIKKNIQLLIKFYDASAIRGIFRIIFL